MDSPYLTTEEAATRMRYASKSPVLALVARGELVPDGRRGDNGAYLFLPETIDTYLKICATRSLGRSSTGSDPAAEVHSRGSNEEDKRTGSISDVTRKVPNSSDSEVPEDTKKERRADYDARERDDVGCDSVAGEIERGGDKRVRRGGSKSRPSDYYRGRLRRHMA